MSGIQWSDGMFIRTDHKEYMVIRKKDGWYVVGKGMCCPDETREEGIEFIKIMEDTKND